MPLRREELTLAQSWRVQSASAPRRSSRRSSQSRCRQWQRNATWPANHALHVSAQGLGTSSRDLSGRTRRIRNGMETNTHTNIIHGSLLRGAAGRGGVVTSVPPLSSKRLRSSSGDDSRGAWLIDDMFGLGRLVPLVLIVTALPRSHGDSQSKLIKSSWLAAMAISWSYLAACPLLLCVWDNWVGV